MNQVIWRRWRSLRFICCAVLAPFSLAVMVDCKRRTPKAHQSSIEGTRNRNDSSSNRVTAFDWDKEVSANDTDDWIITLELFPPLRFQRWTGITSLASPTYVQGVEIGRPSGDGLGVPNCHFEDFGAFGEGPIDGRNQLLTEGLHVYNDSMFSKHVVFDLRIFHQYKDEGETGEGSWVFEPGSVSLYCSMSGSNVRKLKWSDIAEAFSGTWFTSRFNNDPVVSIRPGAIIYEQPISP